MKEAERKEEMDGGRVGKRGGRGEERESGRGIERGKKRGVGMSG